MARATAFAIEPLLDAARVGPGLRVLDVGCGLGTLAAAAAARGATVTGVDLAAGMLAEARRRHPQVEFVLADAEALPFADAAFDVALGAFIVNHLPHPERAAAELRRVARTVALAMWGPEDEVGILGLPARAARDLDANVPPGPDALRFTDAGELAAPDRRHRHRDHADAAHRHTSTSSGTASAAAPSAPPPASPPPRRQQLEAARARLRELAEPYRTPGGLRPPDHDPHRHDLSGCCRRSGP